MLALEGIDLWLKLALYLRLHAGEPFRSPGLFSDRSHH
jgi:hypothetical protein